MSCGVGHRRISDLALLWLWGRPAAIAQIGPLALEHPCAAGAALKRKKERKKEKKRKALLNPQICGQLVFCNRLQFPFEVIKPKSLWPHLTVMSLPPP